MPAETLASPLRILLAEDNAVNQRVIGLTLRRAGYRHDIVPDGDEVLPALCRAAAAGQPYDVVFLDLRMPRMDGLEAARAVRAADVPQPRIVAVTADVTAAKREACFAAGFDGFLSKPVDREALAHVLADVERAVHGGAAALDTPARGGEPEAFPTLSEMACGDEDLFLSLLADARDEIEAGLTATKAALRGEDLPAAGRHVHTLKSVAGLLDAGELYALCATTQDAADAGSLVEAVQAFLPLYAHAQGTLDALATALPSSGEPPVRAALSAIPVSESMA